MTGLFGLGPPVQIAYAVPDARAAAERWVTQHGAGPFVLREHIEVSDVTHRGTPAGFDHTSAYGQWGDVMVELVEDHTVGPSVITDLIPPGCSGLHHLAFFVDDPDLTIRRMADAGHELAMSAHTASGTAFHFVDTVAVLGHYCELYRASERLTRFYAAVADAARAWDGRSVFAEL